MRAIAYLVVCAFVVLFAYSVTGAQTGQQLPPPVINTSSTTSTTTSTTSSTTTTTTSTTTTTTQPPQSTQTPSTSLMILSITPGHRSLGVAWSIPNSINTKDIVAFDIRHIESSASDKSESNWTLTEDFTRVRSSAILSGLDDGTEYDVQVRADLGTDGEWSSTATGTPAGPGDSVATATEFVNNVGVIGHLSSSSDNDYYTFTLTETSEVFLFTSGPLSSDGRFTDGTIDPQGKLYVVDPNNNNQLRLIESPAAGNVEGGEVGALSGDDGGLP